MNGTFPPKLNVLSVPTVRSHFNKAFYNIKGVTANMKKSFTVFNLTVFVLEIALFLLLLFVIGWSIPSNVLNSNALYKLLEVVGIWGLSFLPTGIPIGMIGIIRSKRMEQLRKPTFILSIINLSVGSIEILIWLVIFCAAVFGGASV